MKGLYWFHDIVSLCFIFLQMNVCAVQSTLELKVVQLVHRHGARSPIVSYNQSTICGNVPCGHLNSAGLSMLINAGKFLRAHYTEGPYGSFFPSESYNLSVSYTESTDVLRTIQSAEALLSGLFPNKTLFFPAVHTASDEASVLSRGFSAPYTRAFLKLDTEWWRRVCNPRADTILGYKTLLSISREVFSEGFCANPLKICECAQGLYDIGAAMNASGRIVDYPLLQKYLKQLREVEVFVTRMWFRYNASDKTHVNMGSLGQDLAQQILSNAKSYMSGSSSFKLYHYSGHDTTIAPLASTLGDFAPTALSPPFGQLYAFELLHNPDTDEYSMRVRRGAPGQAPESNYLFSWDNYRLKCMEKSNKVYYAADNTCPFSDFERFVNSTKPRSPAGLCYLSGRHRKLFDCPGSMRKPSNKDCKMLRRACPASACDLGFTLNIVTLECVCSSNECLGTHTTASLIAISLVACCIGALIVLCGIRLFELWKRRRYQSATTSNI
uniref:Uncharacterized protein TCIL3000_11_13530 n=1 Tax=Trypanosoma congolense (strain IL3000) TaxID=1068625 RepID=G0V2H5_TRYCI|nr:unnamed protein product [Trypanosoma congolense IL3000]